MKLLFLKASIVKDIVCFLSNYFIKLDRGVGRLYFLTNDDYDIFNIIPEGLVSKNLLTAIIRFLKAISWMFCEARMHDITKVRILNCENRMMVSTPPP